MQPAATPPVEQKAPTQGARALVVSIHDVCPPFEKQFLQWRRILDTWGITQRTIAIVPFYEGKTHISESPTLLRAIAHEQEQGSEIALHGYSHIFEGRYARLRDRLRDRLTTGGCAEFSHMAQDTAEPLLTQGRSELQQALGAEIDGFIAPGWWQDSAVTAILPKLGFTYSTSVGAVHYFDTRGRIHAPVVTGLPAARGITARLMRYYNFLLLPRCTAKMNLARIALHPYDLHNVDFVDRLGHMVKQLRNSRDITTYEKFAQ